MPAGLFSRVEKIIVNAEFRRARLRFAVFSAVSVFGATGLLAGSWSFFPAFLASDFYQYLSVIFSDGNTIINLWRDMALILAETFPALETASLLTGVFIFLYSLSAAVREKHNLTLVTKIA